MVTSRLRRRRPAGRRVASAAVGLLLLASCGGQVGTAAVVGSSPVSSASIDAQRATLSDAPTSGVPLAAGPSVWAGRVAQDRTLVTYAIWHEQVRQAGLPIPLTEERISAILADPTTTAQITQVLLATPETMRDRLTDTAALQQLVADTVAAATPISAPTVKYELINVDSLADALAARTRYVGDPAAWSADFAAAGTSRGGSGSLNAAGNGAALISTGLFSAAAGDFIVVPAGDASATIVRVADRSLTSEPLDGAALQQAGPAVTNAIGAMLLNRDVDGGAPAVEVNPRYGVWDAQVAQVVPAASQL